MMGKKYDLAVKTGSYTDRDGATKSRYRNIGVVMEGKDGLFMMLNRDFNPAGVPFKDGAESIMVSMFEPREHSARSASVKNSVNYDADLDDQMPAYSGGQRSRTNDVFDDDIPFISSESIW